MLEELPASIDGGQMFENEEAEWKAIFAAGAHKDTFFCSLLSLVAEAENGDSPMPLTITIDGMIVTGTVISPIEYFEALARTNPVAETFVLGIETLRQRIKRDKSNPIAYLDIEHIHMKHARLMHPGSMHGPKGDERGVLWRGRVRSVSSFFVGDSDG